VRRYPYHRYLTYQVLNGDSVSEIIKHMRELEYIPPEKADVEEMRQQLLRRRVTKIVREKHDVMFFDEGSPSHEQMFWMVETTTVRTCAERLLIDRVHPKHIATILSAKFNEKLTQKSVELFREAFWDVVVLTPIDFSDYFRMGRQRKPEPPPETVSLATRSAYAQWKQGLHPDDDELSPDLMIREIRVDSFMHYKELSSGPAKDLTKAKQMAELVLKTAGANKALADSRKGKSTAIPDLAPKLVYPSQEVATLGDLHSEYSENVTGTGAESELMGSREEDGAEPA
jgi:hypothetical protein